jgi:hypothetical protein
MSSFAHLAVHASQNEWTNAESVANLKSACFAAFIDDVSDNLVALTLKYDYA